MCVPLPEKERSKQRLMYTRAKKWTQLPAGIKDITNIKTFKGHGNKISKRHGNNVIYGAKFVLPNTQIFT